MRALLVLASVLTLAAVPPQAHAQWKWRDADGRVTISDRPPPQDVPAQHILSRPPGVERSGKTPQRPAAPSDRASDAASSAATAQAATAKPGIDPELEARKKKAEKNEADEAAKRKEAEEKQAAVMKDNCNRARSHQASLESGQRMTRVNEKGEREVLDDEQRAAEARRTREAIENNCRQ